MSFIHEKVSGILAEVGQLVSLAGSRWKERMMMAREFYGDEGKLGAGS